MGTVAGSEQLHLAASLTAINSTLLNICSGGGSDGLRIFTVRRFAEFYER
jgi:hypothetical protein